VWSKIIQEPLQPEFKIHWFFYAGLYCMSYSHNNNINNHFTAIYKYFYWQFSSWHTTYIFVKFDIQYFVGLIFWQNQLLLPTSTVAQLARSHFASIKYKIYIASSHIASKFGTGIQVTASSQFTAFLKNIIWTALWFDLTKWSPRTNTKIYT
jgi:hypothetical protein